MPGGANRGSAGKVWQDCYTLQQATIDLRRLLRRALPGEGSGPRPATLHQLLALHRVVRQALERLDVRGRIAALDHHDRVAAHFLETAGAQIGRASCRERV